MTKNKNLKSFTLIELLVVLALVAILSVVVVMTLNPAELLKQARDSNRLSDIATINTALNLFSADVTGGFMGTSTIIYVSIPDSSPNCANLGLPTLATSSYTYNCVTAQNLRKTDGTGWIPVNFQAISAGSPISQLPIDSKNSTSTRNYFTYVASGSSWELAFSPEAEKNKLGGANNLTIKDGGQKASLFEIGKNLSLLPVDYGDSSLAGYWAFNEGSGTSVADGSGKGNTGTLQNSPTWASSERCRIDGCLELNGSNNYVSIPKLSNLYSGTMDFSIVVWLYQNDTNGANMLAYTPVSSWTDNVQFFIDGTKLALWGVNSFVFQNNHGLSIGAWHQYVMVRSGNIFKTYADGVQVGANVSDARSLSAPDSTYNIGTVGAATTQFYNGRVDDTRVYNRALSAAEISALYNMK